VSPQAVAMSTAFPHVDVTALKKFAAAAAAGEHACRLSRNATIGLLSSAGKKKGKGKAHGKKPPYPVVTGCEDICYVGEQVWPSFLSPLDLDLPVWSCR
jgi:hypothetical protein